MCVCVSVVCGTSLTSGWPFVDIVCLPGDEWCPAMRYIYQDVGLRSHFPVDGLVRTSGKLRPDVMGPLPKMVVTIMYQA